MALEGWCNEVPAGLRRLKGALSARRLGVRANGMGGRMAGHKDLYTLQRAVSCESQTFSRS